MKDDAEEKMEARSALNRLAALGAGQEQMRSELESVRTDVRSLLLLNVYVLAAVVIAYAVIRYGKVGAK